MPISLELFNFSEAFHIQLLKNIADSFVRLGLWLAERLKQAQAADRATASIPIVWLHGDAVSAWIDAKQWNSLKPANPEIGFGAHLSQGGKTLVGALGDVIAGKDVDEALILPNFLNTMVVGLDVVIASLERFSTPTAAMFDVSKRKASDIFGELALGWRSLLESRTQLIGDGETPGGFAGVLATFAPAGGKTDGGEPLSVTLEAIGRGLVATILLLPILPRYIGALWRELSIFARARALEIFADIEKDALGLRRTIIDLFYVDLRAALREGLGMAIAGRDMAAAMIAMYVEATEDWANDLVSSLQTWFKDLSFFFVAMTDLFHSLQSLLDDLLQVDLMQNLDAMLSGKWWWSAATTLATPPQLLIGDLGDPSTREAAAKRLQDWLTKVANRTLIAGGIVEYEVKQVRGVIDTLLRTKTDEIVETSAFHDLKLTPMPDISEQFTAGLPQFRASVNGMFDKLQTRVTAIADKISTTFDSLGVRFERAAQVELHAPPTGRLTTVAARASALAEAALPDDKGVAPSDAIQKIASSFDDWLTTPGRARKAGFAIVAAAIPKYILAMSQYWAELREAEADKTPPDSGAPPTSPHKLAARRRIASIRTPALHIEAKGRALDGALIDDIVAAFARGIGDAHRQAAAAGG